MVDGQALLRRLEAEAERVNGALAGHLTSHVDLIGEVGRHLLLAGGKRLRPALFLWSAELCGGNGSLDTAVIFEYLHAATLLHDDVIDNAGTRRGKRAANVIWDNPAVVLVGDFLLSKSFSLAVATGDLRTLEVLSDTTTAMAEGQVLELIHTGNLDILEDQYLEVIIAKTAVLIQSACRIGAIAARADLSKEEALSAYGLDMGIAFQMVDDALDYAGTAEEFGKPVGKDLKEGKITYPLIHTLKSCGPDEAEFVAGLNRAEDFSEGDFSRLKDLVDRYQGIEATMTRARQYSERARAALEVFEPSEHRDLLSGLADFVVTRRK